MSWSISGATAELRLDSHGLEGLTGCSSEQTNCEQRGKEVSHLHFPLLFFWQKELNGKPHQAVLAAGKVVQAGRGCRALRSFSSQTHPQQSSVRKSVQPRLRNCRRLHQCKAECQVVLTDHGRVSIPFCSVLMVSSASQKCDGRYCKQRD